MTYDIRLGAWLAVAPALLGCTETTPSEYLRTREIGALIEVRADADSHSKVSVQLVSGGLSGAAVILSPDDSLTASGAGQSDELKMVSSGLYQGTLAISADVDVTVDLDRAEEPDAPNSEGTLPAPFEIVAPASTDVMSRVHNQLLVAWGPEAEDQPGEIRIQGACIVPFSKGVFSSWGSVWVSLEDLDEADPQSCSIEIHVSFTREGTPDPALNAVSSFRTFQERKVVMTSDP